MGVAATLCDARDDKEERARRVSRLSDEVPRHEHLRNHRRRQPEQQILRGGGEERHAAQPA